jgi:formylglycine-generating enzyme required for sulfatase activity
LLHNLQTDEGFESPMHGRRPEADMVRIPGGTFRMGSDQHYLEAKLGETAIDFPPMQTPASFNLTNVKAKIEEAIKAHQGD